MKIGGLIESLPEKKAKRFRLGAILPEINLNELAGRDYSVCTNLEVRDQRSEDSCTSHAVATAIEAHEGTPISAKWQFMQTKLKEGTVDTWGATMEDALSIPVSVGAIAKVNEPIEFRDAPRDVYVRWENWGELDGSEHAQDSYWWIEKGGYPDTFDAIRASIWQCRAKKNAVVTGMRWKSSYTNEQDSKPIRGIISETIKPNDPATPHAFAFCGVKHIVGTPYIVAHLSNGAGFGDHGHFYFPRSVINRECTFGNAMYVDMPLNVAKKINTAPFSPYWNLKLAFVWRTLYKINSLFTQLKAKLEILRQASIIVFKSGTLTSRMNELKALLEKPIV